MNGITHAVVGLASGLAAAHFQQLVGTSIMVCAGAGLIGGLLPDIDHPKASISKYAVGVGGAARLFISHRGATHTLLFAALLIGVLLVIGAPVWAVTAFAAGFLLHIVCDMVTPQGLRILRPLSGMTCRLLPSVVLGAPGVAWAIETLTGAATLLAIGFFIIQEIQ